VPEVKTAHGIVADSRRYSSDRRIASVIIDHGNDEAGRALVMGPWFEAPMVSARSGGVLRGV